MGSDVPTVEIAYTLHFSGRWPREIEYSVNPSIRFFDTRGKIMDFYKKLWEAQDKADRAFYAAITINNYSYWFYFLRCRYYRNRKIRLIRRLKSYIADLLQDEHRTIELTYAWPTSSSNFRDRLSIPLVGQIIHDVQNADDIWVVPLAA